MVPKERLELSRQRHLLLRQTRLPIPPSGHIKHLSVPRPPASVGSLYHEFQRLTKLSYLLKARFWLYRETFSFHLNAYYYLMWQ